MIAPPSYLPTPEEIRQRCAEIQSGWSEAEHYQRMVGYPDGHRARSTYHPAPYTVPMVKLDRELADALAS